jgi:hypothetical protein
LIGRGDFPAAAALGDTRDQGAKFPFGHAVAGHEHSNDRFGQQVFQRGLGVCPFHGEPRHYGVLAGSRRRALIGEASFSTSDVTTVSNDQRPTSS